MRFKCENEVLTIYPQGKVDSSNATEFGNEIETICLENPFKSLVMDIDDIEYISSAGLRVILKLRQKNPDFKIINVSSAVYDVFEMTGFTEMITIVKAMRKIDVEGCEVIGQGSNGIVYRLDADTIIKVYRNPDSLPDIQRERELARRAFVLGIPTAIPYDVVRVGGSYGSVFELLNAKSFSSLILEEPEKIEDYLRIYLDVMKNLHATTVKEDDMPDMKAVAVNWAEFLLDYLPKADSEKLVRLIKEIPERHTMLHGDYHTNNLMMQNGEALLIDMDTLCWGHPIFELASMYMGYVAFGETDPSVVHKFLNMPYEMTKKVWKTSMNLYFGGDEEKAAEVEKKAMVIAYTRLMRRTIRRIGFDDEYGRLTIENCKNHLMKLLAELDTLSF